MKLLYKYFSNLWFLLSVLLLSSCFELREEVSVNQDGSGSFKLLADFSEHKQMLEDLKEEADTAHNPFGSGAGSEFLSILTKGSKKLESIKGITNSHQIADTTNYIFGFGFDFTDVSALNLALVMKDGGEYNADFQLPYRYEGKGKLRKNNVFVFKKIFKHLLSEQRNIPEYLQSQKKAIFAQISYSCVITTEGKIKKVSNKGYERATNRKSIEYSTYLKEIYDSMVDISTDIKFK